MNFDFTKSSILKEAARAIREHNHIHSVAERNAILITEYLNFAADLIDKLANGDAIIAQHGRWKKKNGEIYCTNCKKCKWSESFELMLRRFNFCPNCGARMEKEDENEI